MRRFVPLFSAIVLLIAVGLFRFGETAAVAFPTEGIDITNPDAPRPLEDGRAVLMLSHPLFPCVLGGQAGGRSSEYLPAGLVIPTRTAATGLSARSGFLLGADIRSLYGRIRPHLLFCRLRN